MSLTNLQNFALNILKETKHKIVQDIVVTELPPSFLNHHLIQSSETSALADMLNNDLELGSPIAISPLLGQKDPSLHETEGSHNNNPILIENKTQKKCVSDASNKSSSKKARKQVKKEDSSILKKLISKLTTDASEISKVNHKSGTYSVLYSFGDSLSMHINYYKNLKHGDLASQALVNEEVREQIGEKISNDTF
ncbi:5544_t:CDS:2, partial [Gigaspora margarita]